MHVHPTPRINVTVDMTEANAPTHGPAQPQFVYSAMSDPLHEIRLLRCSFEQGHGVSDVNYEMGAYRLGQGTPAYVAVSYAWGDANRTKEITVSGCSLLITETAELALRQIHHYGKFYRDDDIRYEPRLPGSRRRLTQHIWLDAICINQADVEERSQQVRIMNRIYSRAYCTAASLGVSRSLERLLGIVQPLLQNAELDLLHPSERDEILAEGRIAADEIARSPYFSRMWIIQELKLSNSVYFMSGDFCTEASKFLKSYSSVFEISAESMWNCREKGYRTRLDMLAHEILWQYGWYEHEFLLPKGSDLSLAETIAKYSGGACQDPRDQLYSLLGVTEDIARRYTTNTLDHSMLLNPFEVSYHKCNEDVLFDFIYHLCYTDEPGVSTRAITKLLDHLPINWDDAEIQQRLLAEVNLVKTQNMGPLTLLHRKWSKIRKVKNEGVKLRVFGSVPTVECLSHVYRSLTPVRYLPKTYNREETVLFDSLWVPLNDVTACAYSTDPFEPYRKSCCLPLLPGVSNLEYSGRRLSQFVESIEPRCDTAEVLIHSLDILLALLQQRGHLDKARRNLCTDASFLILREIPALNQHLYSSVIKWERNEQIKPPWSVNGPT